jgi:hypothetical protein
MTLKMGRWTLSQSGDNITGSLILFEIGLCGTVTWQMSGRKNKGAAISGFYGYPNGHLVDLVRFEKYKDIEKHGIEDASGSPISACSAALWHAIGTRSL